jgi:hypothetical protein
VRFVVKKVELRQVSSDDLGFLRHRFHRLLHAYNLSYGAGTIGQIVIDIPSLLSLTASEEKEYRPFYKYIQTNNGIPIHS